MIRVLVGAARIANTAIVSSSRLFTQNVTKSSLISINRSLCVGFQQNAPKESLLQNPSVTSISNGILSRNVTKFSFRKGKRKSVKAVLKRFYRLHWGGWVRTMCGRNKKLWKKSPPRKRRLRQHVFCNATQSHLLDKMVGSYWRKPKYYVDDPYEPYHRREEWQFTYTKPRPYFPPEQ